MTSTTRLSVQEASILTRMLNSALESVNADSTRSINEDVLDNIEWFAREAGSDYFIIPSVPYREVPQFRIPNILEEVRTLKITYHHKH